MHFSRQPQSVSPYTHNHHKAQALDALATGTSCFRRAPLLAATVTKAAHPIFFASLIIFLIIRIIRLPLLTTPTPHTTHRDKHGGGGGGGRGAHVELPGAFRGQEGTFWRDSCGIFVSQGTLGNV